jgi:hypothetical protein
VALRSANSAGTDCELSGPEGVLDESMGGDYTAQVMQAATDFGAGG